MAMKELNQMALAAVILLCPLFPVFAQEKNVEEFVFLEDEKQVEPLMKNRRLGEEALAKGLPSTAVDYLKEYCRLAANSEPDASHGRVLLSRAYLNAERPQEALQCIDQWQKNPAAKATLRDKEQLQLNRGEALLRLKRGEEGAKELLPLVAGPTQDDKVQYNALCLLGDYWCTTGEWQKAKDLLQGRVDKYSLDSARFSQVLMLLARAQVSLKEPQARDTLDKLLGVTRLSELQRLEAQLLRIRALTAAGEIESALAAYEKISSRGPASRSAMWRMAVFPLAHAAFNAGRFAEATRLAEVAVRLSEDGQEWRECVMLLAEARYRNGDLPAAVGTLEELLKTSKKEPAAVRGRIALRLGEILRENRVRRSAAERFAAIAQDGQMPKDLRYRAAVQGGDCWNEEGEVAKAVKLYLLAADNAPDEATAVNSWKIAANSYEKAGKVVAAAELHVRIAEKFPAAAESRLEAGRLYCDGEKLQLAMEQYDLFAKQNPASPRVWEAKLASAVTAGKLAGRDKAAVAVVREKLLEIASAAPEEVSRLAYFETQRLAELVGDHQGAIDALAAFEERFPDSVWRAKAMHGGIVLRMRMGDAEGAKSMCRNYLEKFPVKADDDASVVEERAQVQLLLGDLLVGEGDYAEAQKIYNQVTGQQQSTATYEVAWCCYMAGDYTAALEKLQPLVALEDTPANRELLAHAYYLLGDVFAAQNNPQKAQEAFKHAWEKAGKNALGYSALGRQAEMLLALRGEGDQENANIQTALACLKEVETAPKLPRGLQERARYLQGRCYELKGDVASAISIYRKLFLEFPVDISNGVDNHRLYFEVGENLARLLEERAATAGGNNLEDYRWAKMVYDRLAASNYPRAEEAKKRSEKLLREKLGNRR